MKDSAQKEILCKHFQARGWYVQPEVPVFHKGGMNEERKIITDVDIYGLRPGDDLRWEVVVGDCKTLKGESPSNRVIWLRGLMDYLGASWGIVILKRKRPIESDHRLFASSLGIMLIDETEFKKYDRGIIYPSGSETHHSVFKSLGDARLLSRKYPALTDFCKYVYGLAWNEENRIDLLRRLIGEAQGVSGEIDPAKTEHLALVIDAASAFSVALAECVGLIFAQHLDPKKESTLDSALKMLIWGGRSHYEFASKLRKELLRARGKPVSDAGDLVLPEWSNSIQLVRNLLEYPRLSFQVPHLLSRAACDVRLGSAFLGQAQCDDLLVLKYAMLATDYFCKAAKFPIDTRKTIEKKFVSRQSDIVHSSKQQYS